MLTPQYSQGESVLGSGNVSECDLQISVDSRNRNIICSSLHPNMVEADYKQQNIDLDKERSLVACFLPSSLQVENYL